MSFSRAIVKLQGVRGFANHHRFLTTSTHKNVLEPLDRRRLSFRQFKRLDSASVNKLIFDCSRNFSVARKLYSDKENVNIPAPEVSKSSGDYFIPEPPQAPTSVEGAGSELLFNQLGEPTFQSLGIGTSYFPSDFILKFLEMIHVSVDLPWWGVLGIATVVVRTVMFPLIINFRKKSADFSNNMPTLKKLQERLDSARLQNNMLEMTKVANEMNSFMERNGVISAKSMLFFPIFNGIAILSFLSSIRQMANYPIASMQDGGLFWFTDLTLPDAYCILPLTCVASIYIIMEIGADMTKISEQSKMMRYAMRGFPIVVFFFMMNMPAAVTYYFTVSNFFSIVQTYLLKTKKLRSYFDIPAEIKQPKETLSSSVGGRKLGFWDSLKESKRRSEMLRMVAERERLDDKQFRDAGKALVRKTVPLKSPKSSSNNSEKELRRA